MLGTLIKWSLPYGAGIFLLYKAQYPQIVNLFKDYCNAVEKEKNKPDGGLYLIIVP